MFGCCKTFFGKYIFFENANFRKRKMFPWCLVAFQKIFRKIFSSVWKRRRKTQIQKNTSHNPGKNHQRWHWTPFDDRAVDRDLRSRSTARSRSRLLREIAIFARSQSTATGMFASEITIGKDWRSRPHALSLFLSLIFRKYFEAKIEV